MAELDLELDREQRRSEPTSGTAQRSRGHIRGRQTCMENDLGVSVRFGSYFHQCITQDCSFVPNYPGNTTVTFINIPWKSLFKYSFCLFIFPTFPGRKSNVQNMRVPCTMHDYQIFRTVNTAKWKASRPRPNVYVVARPVDSVTLTVAAGGGRNTPSPLNLVSYAPDTSLLS